MKKALLMAFALSASVVAVASAHASNDVAAVAPTDQDLLYRGVLQSQKNAIQSRRTALGEVIRKKTKTFQALEASPGTASFVWDDGTKVPRERKRLARLIKLQIQQSLEEITRLEQDQTRLEAEIAWVDVQKKESIQIPTLTDNPNLEGNGRHARFRCDSLPVKALEGQALDLVQDFGIRRDPETGLEWPSLGWWIGHIGSQVTVCQPGTVVYVGKVPGRGRVVLVEHANGFSTLYANLADDPGLKITKGLKIARGAVVGTPLDRFYFEVRSAQGQAVNPRLVVAGAQLTTLGL